MTLPHASDGKAGPQVTVLMPVHNAAAYLRDALYSIRGQSFSDFEILAIDDASTDESKAVLASFDDPRLRVIRSEERIKLAGALNLGLVHARGALIARMDSDDLARPDRLRRQVSFMNSHPEVAVCGGAIRLFGAGRTEKYRYPESDSDIRAFALFDCPFAHPAVILRKSAIEARSLRYNVDYFPTEDYEFWVRLLDEAVGANLPNVLIDYRVHPESLTASRWEQMDRQAARIVQPMLVALGMPAETADVSYHRALSQRRIEPTLGALQKAEGWLSSLLARNERVSRYEPVALKRTVAWLWFMLAMRVDRGGWRAWKAYVRSPLTDGDARRSQRAIILALSLLRRHARGLKTRACSPP